MKHLGSPPDASSQQRNCQLSGTTRQRIRFVNPTFFARNHSRYLRLAPGGEAPAGGSDNQHYVHFIIIIGNTLLAGRSRDRA